MSSGWNNIKSRGNAFALQCTRSARSGGFVDESTEPPHCAETYVIAIGELILVFDDGVIRDEDRTSIITSTARDIGVIGAAGFSRFQHEGNGYQVNLPRDVVESAGHFANMDTSFASDENVMVIYRENSRQASEHVDEILDHRRAQVANPDGEDDA